MHRGESLIKGKASLQELPDSQWGQNEVNQEAVVSSEAKARLGLGLGQGSHSGSVLESGLGRPWWVRW